MQETISQPTVDEPSPADLVRTVLCPMCWSPPGRCCTIGGLPGDHLVRWTEAVNAGLLSKEELAGAIAGLTVIADHVMIMERAAA